MFTNRFFRLLSVALALFLSLSISVPIVENNHAKLAVLSKRNSALYDLWNSIPATKKAQGISALEFTIDHSTSDAWGITYLYGCTGIVISDRNFVVVAHISEESGNCVSLGDRAAIQRFIDNNLEPALDLHDPGPSTKVQLIYNSNQPQGTVGLTMIRDYINNDWGFSDAGGTIRLWPTVGGSGTGEPNPDSPSGLTVVQYIAGNGNPTGVVKVFLGSSPNQENPIEEDAF